MNPEGPRGPLLAVWVRAEFCPGFFLCLSLASCFFFFFFFFFQTTAYLLSFPPTFLQQ